MGSHCPGVAGYQVGGTLAGWAWAKRAFCHLWIDRVFRVRNGLCISVQMEVGGQEITRGAWVLKATRPAGRTLILHLNPVTGEIFKITSSLESPQGL